MQHDHHASCSCEYLTRLTLLLCVLRQRGEGLERDERAKRGEWGERIRDFSYNKKLWVKEVQMSPPATFVKSTFWVFHDFKFIPNGHGDHDHGNNDSLIIQQHASFSMHHA